MSVFKLYPEKDATIFSAYPAKNSGIDEILEISTYLNQNYSNQVAETSRILIQFPSQSISDIIGAMSGSASSSFKAFLRLSLSDAVSIPINYSIYAYPVAPSSSWTMGTGRINNNPFTTNGASWAWSGSYDAGGKWNTGSLGAYATASYTSSNGGGGIWITGSTTLNPVASQSFSYMDDRDLNINVTNTVLLWNSGSVVNNGFLIKQDSLIEFTTSSIFSLKFFSVDSHTIYPPCLEFRWDDSSYVTSSLSIISTNKVSVGITNNKGAYKRDSIEKFRLSVRDMYPARAFQTSSVYLNSKALPSSSYYAIKDASTEEYVVDYDTNYTKISADSSGNYFVLNMSGLEVERWYTILIKSAISGESIIFDSKFLFKVVR